MQRTVQLVFCDVVKTKFMQEWDLFEPFKVVMAPILTCKVTDDFDLDHVQRMVDASRSESYLLIACVGEGVDWVDPNVKAVSDGSKWSPIEDYINHIKGGPQPVFNRVYSPVSIH